MSEDPLKAAQAMWEAEFGHLDDVARAVLFSRRGQFLVTFAQAWLRADAFNKRILRGAWESLIKKYDLEEEAEG